MKMEITNKKIPYGEFVPNSYMGISPYDHKEIAKPNYQNIALDDLVKSDERIMAEEIENIEHQIAEREKIKRRNIKFLEDQRQKLDELISRADIFSYRVMGKNEVKSKLTTLLVQVEIKKGEEYVNAFRDVQRLEEEKRKLSAEEKENKGWLK
jgi:hypothetical protein